MFFVQGGSAEFDYRTLRICSVLHPPEAIGSHLNLLPPDITCRLNSEKINFWKWETDTSTQGFNY